MMETSYKIILQRYHGENDIQLFVSVLGLVLMTLLVVPCINMMAHNEILVVTYTRMMGINDNFDCSFH